MFLAIMTILLAIVAGQAFVHAQSPTENPPTTSKLAVLWTSGDPEVAHKVCLMYTHAAKKAKAFDEVLLIVWGPSARLLVGDKELQAKLKEMMVSGVKIQACVACADMYGVSEKLRELGIEVKGMGRPLTEMLKSDWKILTF